MDTPVRMRFLPIGGILDRYLAEGFLRVFFLSLLCVTVLYLIVEFFDRVDNFLDAGAPVWTAVRYFLYKLPLSISRVIGFATLFSGLFCLGMLARTQEITAMRSSGLSLQRIAIPLLLLSVMICLFTFIWNEGLVPIFTRKAQAIYKTEVKNKQLKSLLGTRDIWIRGENSFINVEKFDTRKNTLEGISIFPLDRDFSLKGFVEIPLARWTGSRWETKKGTEWRFLSDGKMIQRNVIPSLPFSETPEDLKLLARDPEEFTFFELQKQIADLGSKGIDATEYEVDLQVKLALPFISPLMILIAVPFALKRRLGGGMALSFGVAMLIAFGYWVLLAFCVSLGRSGALPPWISAWLANFVFALIGIFFASAEE